MYTWHSRPGALSAVFATLLASAVARSDEPPANRLSGLVVDKDSGAPVANVFVAMVHRGEGYLHFDELGLRGGGNDEKILGIFTKRNGKHFCDAVTDAAGQFTMTNFAAANQSWYIAAGDAEHGWALQLNVHPGDYAERPLRLELEKPAYVVTTLPPAPDRGLRVSVSVSLAPPELLDSSQDGAAESDDSDLQIVFQGPRRPAKPAAEVRLGPLPADHKYRVAACAHGLKVPYEAILFARTLAPAAGATKKLSLEPAEGGTVTGRITSTEDKPLANVNVMAETADGLVIGALTDDDGRYALHGVPPGEHTLRLLRHAVRAVPG